MFEFLINNFKIKYIFIIQGLRKLKIKNEYKHSFFREKARL